ncbi:MAG: DNA polymerase III subunit alpha [Hyphomicrobium sp. 12-62-95]|nr:MAG: DNA polymerase III subunit alpha [Hyphomicrobium sp. 12-62-95]
MTQPIPLPPKFIHLKVHSAYSLLEGALPIGKLAKLADGYGFPALGISDTNNMFGGLEFSDKLAGAGIQPIVGVSLSCLLTEKTAKPGQLPGPIVRQHAWRDGLLALYAMNDAGYANLMKLVSAAHLGTEGEDAPFVRADQIAKHAGGLIALTGGPDGPIDRALLDGQPGLAEERLAFLKRAFGDRLYVEVQRHGTRAEQEVEPQLLELAYRLGVPIVATNEVYFATPDDFEAHDALLCIADGRYVSEDDRRRVTREHHLKSGEAMAELFADLPESVANTVEIAKRCAFRPKGKKPILPRFVQASTDSEADQLAAEAAELKRQAEEGLRERLKIVPLAAGFTEDDYWARLAFEVDVITKMKFPGYFLIVADFIKWSKANGIPVGPGRGSGAGSLVAYSLTITDLDPLRFGLLFERFLNPERVSMPDFDIDFCQDKRDQVIRYVQQKYGSDRVAQIITHGKLQARAVLRDVGRVLQMPYGQVDRLCKLVPNNPANPVTLDQAIEGEPKLQEARDTDEVVRRLLQVAQKLEGLYRHASTHAAGIVIGDRPLDELVPLYRDPKSNMPVTQFNWKMVEAAGLVKFDFLGLKTLTVLEKAVELIRRGRGISVDLATLPLDDVPAYQLLAKADTVGVFQLESTGMRESLKRLKPDRFEDIIAMVALYRPGPMDNIPTYINRKHGEEPVDFLHPMLEGILNETYGVIIYQEQVMQIAQVLAGYSLGQADLLRRAMGKKDKAEMAKQQALFVEGAMKNGVKKDDAVYIFELVDKFAGYGFNKSHAAAYALVSYHTAYLKANFREEFLAASMTLDMGNTDKLSMFAAEAKKSGIPVLPPCVNASEVDFLVETISGGAAPSPLPIEGDGERGRRAIRYSLAALKNIGASAVETIVAARTAEGPYRSLSDFASRLNPKALNKRGLETLSMAGAFDGLEPNRALVRGNVEGMIALANRQADNAAQGTSDLFGGGGGGAPSLDLKPAKAWTPMEKLQEEFDAIGFFLSGHPLDAYETVLKKLGVRRFVEFEAATARGVSSGRLAGIVISARERRSQKGNKFAFAMFSDASGQFEAVIFSDTLTASRDLLEGGTPVVLNVEAERDGDTVKMRVQSMEALDKAAAEIERGLKIVFDTGVLAARRGVVDEFKAQLKPGQAGVRKGGEVRLVLPVGARELEIVLPGRYDVSPAQAGQLSTVPGVIEVLEI